LRETPCTWRNPKKQEAEKRGERSNFITSVLSTGGAIILWTRLQEKEDMITGGGVQVRGPVPLLEGDLPRGRLETLMTEKTRRKKSKKKKKEED